MLLTEHWSFRSQPRISRKGFIEVARSLFATEVLAEREPGQYWDAIVATGIDPLFILAMFNHESSCGKAGVAQSSRSWGNTRWPAFGPAPINTPADSGFAYYATWLDGVTSTCARLNDHVYRGRFTIRQVFIWEPDPQVAWAPSGDSNNPESYLNTVVRFMNRYKGSDGDASIIGLREVPTVLTAHLPPQPNYQQKVEPYSSFVGVTIHETDNAQGAGAIAHMSYLREGAIKADSSWHITVDDTTVVVNLPLNLRAHHAGDSLGKGSWTYAIELCTTADAVRWERTVANGVWVAAQLLRIVGLNTGKNLAGWNIDTFLSQHNKWKGKNCPRILRASGEWPSFLGKTARAIQGEAEAARPAYRFFPETGKTMGGGFLRFWEDRGGLEIYGFPITEEYWDADVGCVVQYTERARFEYRPDQPLEWRVQLGLVGKELMLAQEDIANWMVSSKQKQSSSTSRRATRATSETPSANGNPRKLPDSSPSE